MFDWLRGKDPWFQLLASLGYNTVREPKSTIKPLQLFAVRNKQVYSLGLLSEAFTSGGHMALPSVSENNPMAKISGKESGKLDLGFVLSILKGFLTALGGFTANLDAAYKRSKSTSFQYENVLEDRAEVIAVDKFLSDASIDPYCRGVKDLLESDQVCVTTSTIKSNKLTIVLEGSRDASLNLKIPEIQKIVGSEIRVSGQKENSSNISFEGKLPLVFGFQAWQLHYDGDKYTIGEPSEDKTMFLLREEVAPKLLSEGLFISLGD